ncbi:TPA: thioredoxin-disulfide reductase [Candidatus Collierbacteria bacterium]|uniref:Thioredoxin reductase n=1 Tax=Candidatus Collierbacteria bacterium GW2011_GWA2_42_17 TaxID=1618378 RepID=A0A0G0Z283_9BACT|nr:MAG: Thioredoxin reductase [Candidatus Collierbacteria bacterium GW2011_GWB2_42_12]KKS42884.1 MAG: Thioredoxin reductase [Candidatus Collierbacteria bacterium GW2011_GWA2_42_17]KKS63268.1 MAG: Thioredoxin reductase [Candidatus Collierbacteria bacterium GW2011_GWD2_42_50]KKS63310.1 MAG: Thioredoxin reductase [Candidatus Collierbacteria bacterium GW2011_GWF1_42_50]KKS64462.1 MAG: Thioredoxin reductase [Candidatus Collierbacteria bacterium GW2011_GWF2_42_51]KKS67750.1 MAG: Thioredoxin reductas
MTKYDVIVIGGGPSGYTSAIYLSRDTLSVLVLAGAQPGGQLIFTSEVENFPGFSKGIMGPDLMTEMETQAKRFGAEVMYSEATKVDLTGEIKKVWVGETVYEARAVVVSTGASSKMIGIGEEKYIGRGVSTCAVCDAAFFKNKKTFVVGGGDSAMEDTLALVKFADEVTVVHRRGEFRASKIMQERVLSNPKVKVLWNSEVIEVAGEPKLSSIKVKDVKTGKITEHNLDGLFVAIGHVPTTKLFEGKLELNESGYLRTTMTALMSDTKWRVSEKDMWLDGYPTMTSIEGVFGCGDVVDYRYRQAITAAGMGCQAALDTEKYLENHK